MKTQTENYVQTRCQALIDPRLVNHDAELNRNEGNHSRTITYL